MLFNIIHDVMIRGNMSTPSGDGLVRLLDFLVHGKVEVEVFWVPYKYHVIVLFICP